MSRPVSLTDQQIQAINLLKGGRTQAEVSELIGVCRRTLIRWGKIPEYRQILEGEAPAIITTKVDTPGYNPYELVCREEMRFNEWNLLNSAQNAIIGRVESGDLRAVALLLKISENRRKLLGLDIQPLPAVRAVESLASDGLATEPQSSAISSIFSQAEKTIKNTGNDTSVDNYRKQLEEMSEEELMRLYRAELG